MELSRVIKAIQHQQTPKSIVELVDVVNVRLYNLSYDFNFKFKFLIKLVS